MTRWILAEMRTRLIVVAVFVALQAGFLIALQPRMASVLDVLELEPADETVLAPRATSYDAFVKGVWEGGPGSYLLLYLTAFLSVGGVMSARSSDRGAVLFTLPADRSRWIWAQGGIALATGMGLAVASSVVMTMGSLGGVGPDYSIGRGLMASTLMGWGCPVAVAIALAISAWTRDSGLALLLAFGSIALLGSLPGPYGPWEFVALESWKPVPWRSLLVATFLASAALAEAARRLHAIDI